MLSALFFVRSRDSIGRKFSTTSDDNKISRHAWADAKENANNYFNDDMVQRIGTFWTMALLVLYSNNAPLVGEDLAAMRVTVGTYMVLRFSQVSLFAYYTPASPFHRFQERLYAGLITVGLCFGIPLMLESVTIRSKIALVVDWIAWEVSSRGLPCKNFTLHACGY